MFPVMCSAKNIERSRSLEERRDTTIFMLRKSRSLPECLLASAVPCVRRKSEDNLDAILQDLRWLFEPKGASGSGAMIPCVRRKSEDNLDAILHDLRYLFKPKGASGSGAMRHLHRRRLPLTPDEDDITVTDCLLTVLIKARHDYATYSKSLPPKPLAADIDVSDPQEIENPDYRARFDSLKMRLREGLDNLHHSISLVRTLRKEQKIWLPVEGFKTVLSLLRGATNHPSDSSILINLIDLTMDLLFEVEEFRFFSEKQYFTDLLRGLLENILEYTEIVAELKRKPK